MVAADPEVWESFDTKRSHYREAGAPRPVRINVWRPESGPTLSPVVLISHGAGGSGADMSWLARPLAETGLTAVTVDHHGNNYVDGYLAEGFAYEWERARDLTYALDELAKRQPVGPVGSVGFSSGGYTCAALVGARIDGRVLEAVLDGHAEMPELPEFPDLLNALRESVSEPELRQAIADGIRDYSDPRVGAAFLICPSIGQLVTDESLASITRPVEIRWGEADVITPPPLNALRYLHGIPSARGKSVGVNVEHYHFLDSNPAGAAARAHVAAEAAAFFMAQLEAEDPGLPRPNRANSPDPA